MFLYVTVDNEEIRMELFNFMLVKKGCGQVCVTIQWPCLYICSQKFHNYDDDGLGLNVFHQILLWLHEFNKKKTKSNFKSPLTLRASNVLMFFNLTIPITFIPHKAPFILIEATVAIKTIEWRQGKCICSKYSLS